MRIFAVSDLHVDFEENKKWVEGLSLSEYQDDILILAGDITDIISLMVHTFKTLRKRFREVLYVPGNHDLWVARNQVSDSLKLFSIVLKMAEENGIKVTPCHLKDLSIVPLFGWYDYSFGMPSQELKISWVDFNSCKWPNHYNEKKVTQHFLSLNTPHLEIKNTNIISFSHFLPRIDVMPDFIPLSKRIYYPVFGTNSLDAQIRKLGSDIHVYGHSHVNLQVKKNGVTYINNAFGYPYETLITTKKLRCIYII